MTANADAAAAARAIAGAAPAGSLRRRAAGCAAVVLGHARTVAGAKKMLRASSAMDDQVRDAATDLIDTLTTKETLTDG